MYTMISLRPMDLAISALLLLVVGLLSYQEGLGLERNLFVGTIRTFLQLMLVGYLLKLLFAHPAWGWVVFTLGLMTAFAVHAAVTRQSHYIPGSFQIVAIAIGAGAFVTLLVTIGVVIRPSPWYQPQYIIPLAGMIIGNAMNGASLLLNRLQADMHHRRAEVEAALSLGASPRQASAALVRDAFRASMIPTINVMMTMGLVQLPGMMTGQIIAGSSPLEAVRYQIMIIYMITAAVAVTCAATAGLSDRIFFTSAQQVVPGASEVG